MKVLFAVSNEEISESVVKRYQREYKEIISYKNVYYFNAILKEIQKDKSYDRIVISEDLESFTHTQYDQIDKFLFEKLDSISDEASNAKGDDIPIILICSDRRTKAEQMLSKIFGIGIYNAIIGNDRSVEEVCNLIRKPRSKKEAKIYYKIDSEDVGYEKEDQNEVSETEMQNILAHYKRLGKDEEKYVQSFDSIAAQYNDTQLKIICKYLPLNVRAVLEEKSEKYQKLMAFNSKVSESLRKATKVPNPNEGHTEKLLKPKIKEVGLSKPVVIPSEVKIEGSKKLSRINKKQVDENQNINQDMNNENNQALNSEDTNSQNVANSNGESQNSIEGQNANSLAIGGASGDGTDIVEENQDNLSQEEQDLQNIKATTTFIKPIEGVITSSFGVRDPTSPNVPKNHTGTDIAAAIGTKIKSATEGEVVLASEEGDYGKHLKIQIGEVSIIYAHCNALYVNQGDKVVQGQEIAEVGSTGNSTGPHLHFEVRYKERVVDPQKILDL